MSDSSQFHKEKTLFGKDRNPSNILPTKYTLDSKLKFRCHPGVSCFTECCGGIKIVLTPYDILMLRKRLNMEAADFLHTYTEPTYLEKTDMPGVNIQLNEDGRCPFVTPAGCTVYTDRPSACRYYPVGMANFHEGAQENQTSEEFYFVVKESHCKGFEEDKEWTIREWRADQGVDVRDRMNKAWMELVMRRKSFGFQATLSEPAKRMFFLASTDLEQFKKFVFDSSFLETYIVDDATLEKIKTDDIELMHFAVKFLASSMFGTQDIPIRQEKIERRMAEMKQGQAETEKELLQRAEKELADIKKEQQKMQEEQRG